MQCGTSDAPFELSVIGYLTALVIGLYLVLSILFSDRKDKQRVRRPPLGGSDA